MVDGGPYPRGAEVLHGSPSLPFLFLSPFPWCFLRFSHVRGGREAPPCGGAWTSWIEPGWISFRTRFVSLSIGSFPFPIYGTRKGHDLCTTWEGASATPRTTQAQHERRFVARIGVQGSVHVDRIDMLLLFETAAGFGLFKVLDEGKVREEKVRGRVRRKHGQVQSQAKHGGREARKWDGTERKRRKKWTWMLTRLSNAQTRTWESTSPHPMEPTR